jgi:hypothetical protein
VPSAPVDEEAKKRNGNLPGQGGVFNYVNLHVYHYAGNNPINLTDPNGETTEIDEATGEVKNVIGDHNNAIIAYPYSSDGTRLEGPGNYIGESFLWDSFKEGDIINIGVDKTNDLYSAVKSSSEPNIITGIKSFDGGKYDIKTSWGIKSKNGFLFEGKYASMRDLGNVLAGINARVGGTSFDRFQRMAGAVEVTKGKPFLLRLFAVGLAYLGVKFGPPPDYGEKSIQYDASRHGYFTSYNDYLNWRNSKLK